MYFVSPISHPFIVIYGTIVKIKNNIKTDFEWSAVVLGAPRLETALNIFSACANHVVR